MNTESGGEIRGSGRLWLRSVCAAAAGFALVSCAPKGGEKVQVTSIPAPPGTIRAVFFEYVAHCKRNTDRSSAADPETSCSIEMTGVSVLEPQDGQIVVNRALEVGHDQVERGSSWDEQGVELIAYGPQGAAAFSTRLWHDFTVWSPAKGAAKFASDPRAANAALSEVDRRSFAFEPLAAAIETLFEVPARMRLDLRPFVADVANLFEALVVEPSLSDESRDRVAQHLSTLDEAMREWGVDWLARRGVESTGS